MEKFRVGVFLFLLLVIAVLTFSLTKSWRLYDSGYEVNVEQPVDTEKEKESILEPEESSIDLEDGNAKVYWKQFLVYPVGLVKENGGIGPDGILSHARNLFSVNLKTGSVKKFFKRDIYVWDFFPGEFTKKTTQNAIDEPKEDVLSIERRLIVIAATKDSNKDSVLNHKDYKTVFLFDPDKELVTDVLPEGYHFRKLIFNTQKNQLVLIVQRNPSLETEIKGSSKEKTKKPSTEIYSYDILLEKGIFSAPIETAF
ncbi:hypothetical protein LPTSP4_13010 [Leptospira ryugenii]|uniref:Uncharacterized protein n=1 Tax=Leptospira ryugenii TaxID=1917863 RepID=A0A2P2DYT9_9LEPT|nr:hypothetical protein [Leptospira ryugenii]GBF49782.1 hypothetical protein LPTSP4_13010 [Leptospira ryugenii]